MKNVISELWKPLLISDLLIINDIFSFDVKHEKTTLIQVLASGQCHPSAAQMLKQKRHIYFQNRRHWSCN